MENFRSPNFELVADILHWLLHRFEPSAVLSDDITTEARRVAFITSVCAKILSINGMKLNPKKLYGADGYAVKEMLKLATLLNDAQRSIVFADPADDKNLSDDAFGLSSKLSDLKGARQLCSDIVESGAGLFDLFEKEKESRPEREKALRFLDGMSRNLDSNSEQDVVERALQQLIGSQSGGLEQLKTMSEELQRDEKGLEQRIKKKRQELDRCRKRMQSLADVRPAFMDEYEQLEQSLERYYEQYVGRFRNLDYLEHEVDTLNREETERIEENDRALKRMQNVSATPSGASFVERTTKRMARNRSKAKKIAKGGRLQVVKWRMTILSPLRGATPMMRATGSALQMVTTRRQTVAMRLVMRQHRFLELATQTLRWAVQFARTCPTTTTSQMSPTMVWSTLTTYLGEDAGSMPTTSTSEVVMHAAILDVAV
jgi:clusterin-associated protein 1